MKHSVKQRMFDRFDSIIQQGEGKPAATVQKSLSRVIYESAFVTGYASVCHALKEYLARKPVGGEK